MDQEHWEFHIWNGDIMGITTCAKTAQKVANELDGLIAILVTHPVLFQGLKSNFSAKETRCATRTINRDVRW